MLVGGIDPPLEGSGHRRHGGGRLVLESLDGTQLLVSDSVRERDDPPRRGNETHHDLIPLDRCPTNGQPTLPHGLDVAWIS